MRRYLSAEFTVGAFALLGLLIIIYMSLQVNDRGSVGGSSKIYQASFQSASGMVKKTPIEVSGIVAGYVENVELRDNQAHVTLRIREDVKVYTNSALTIKDRGVLGDKFLLLIPGTPDHPLLDNEGEIPKTYSASDFERITSALTDTAEILKELVVSDEPKGALGKVVINLRDLTGRVNEMVGDNQGRINRIVENLETFSKDLNEITSENKEQIHTVLVALNDVAVSMKDALGKEGSISKATERLDQTLSSVQRIVEKVERGEGTVGKLLNDETTVDNLNQAIEGVNETLGLFRKIQLGVRYRGEFLFSDKELQNLIGISIAPSPDKYLLIELVDAPSGQTKVVDTIVNSGGAVISSTQTIQTDDDILFTLLLAKRFWDATFRVGLIRNEGGVGMDYHLLKDKLTLSFEAFDFSRVNNRAHLRAYGTLILYKHLLLTGGVDDLISNVNGKNAFFGGGLQFTDNDLKALITALPGRL